jgi:hypothetical protein
MAKQSAPPARRHSHRRRDQCVAIKGMIPAVETIQAFARESGHALVRTNWHIEKLRKAHRMEAAIQADFLKDSMERAVQHASKYVEMLATFPHELMQPVNVTVEIAEAARQPAARRRSGAFPRLPIKLKVTASPAVLAKKLSGGSGIEQRAIALGGKVPKNRRSLSDSVTANFGVINPKDFRVPTGSAPPRRHQSANAWPRSATKRETVHERREKPLANRLCQWLLLPPRVTVLSAVGIIRRNIWSEAQVLQCPQRAGIQ